jgi:hypothetical protein
LGCHGRLAKGDDMDAGDFTTGYLQPSSDGLDRRFVVPLPDIAGLEQQAAFIVQGRQATTFSTNIIATHASAAEELRVVEVYKNSQDEVSGVFLRLVGTMALLRRGYPFMFVDAAMANVNPLTAQREAVSTRVAVHMPQADPVLRRGVFDRLDRQAAESGIETALREVPALPACWGPLWSARSAGAQVDMIAHLRRGAWEAYAAYCAQTPRNERFDYTPTQHQMIFKNAVAEYLLFQRMGLSVPAEAQAAFFSVLSFVPGGPPAAGAGGG